MHSQSSLGFPASALRLIDCLHRKELQFSFCPSSPMESTYKRKMLFPQEKKFIILRIDFIFKGFCGAEKKQRVIKVVSVLKK